MKPRVRDYHEEFPVRLSMKDIFWIMAALRDYNDKDLIGDALFERLKRAWDRNNGRGFSLPPGI